MAPRIAGPSAAQLAELRQMLPQNSSIADIGSLAGKLFNTGAADAVTKPSILGRIMGFGGNLLGGGSAALLIDAGSRLLGGDTAAVSAAPVAEPSDPKGKYFDQPVDYMAYERWYQNEMYKRGILRGLGMEPSSPDPISPQEFRLQTEAIRERQAQSLTEREMAKEAQKLEAEILRERIMRGGLENIAEMQGLAAIQQERLKGSYGMAQGVLENAIENVLKSGTISDRSGEVALAALA